MFEPAISDYDVHLFREGSHFRLYEKFGSHVVIRGGEHGTRFAVWAPNASKVSVVGDFNGWAPDEHPMIPRLDGSGIWESFIPGLGSGQRYKYHIVSVGEDYRVDKGDPFARYWELPPDTASVVYDARHDWGDDEWMASRLARNALDAPLNIYEVHAGSWRRVVEQDMRFLTYRELAVQLGDYLTEMGYTHVEFMPIMEHPFYGSWGYQTLGYFAPTRRYGTPEDFAWLVDHLHQRGIGVILDWVPSHFPSNEYGLGYFDGTHLYEYADPARGWHVDWGSLVFDFGRNEVRAFLISSAMYWLNEFHVDGLRVDAVASMLYLDYSRQPGQWTPNPRGGRENLEAVSLLRRLNEAVYAERPDVLMIAEESTSWPMVSHPTYSGGLGFAMKWNMGWMHDTLDYLRLDPIYREYHHNELTFSIWYAFSENFVLALSHDEVVHGKGSLLGKMPGDDWQRMATLRLLLGYMYTHPGKKLLFMGGEFGQWREWTHDISLDWHLLQYPPHEQLRRWSIDVNQLYLREAALHRMDFVADGFEWVNANDVHNCVLSYLRRPGPGEPPLLVVGNFTPIPRHDYVVGVPEGGFWEEILNSDAPIYGGSGLGNLGGVNSSPIDFFGRFGHSLSLTLPPLSLLVLRRRVDAPASPGAGAEQPSGESAPAAEQPPGESGPAAKQRSP